MLSNSLQLQIHWNVFSRDGESNVLFEQTSHHRSHKYNLEHLDESFDDVVDEKDVEIPVDSKIQDRYKWTQTTLSHMLHFNGSTDLFDSSDLDLFLCIRNSCFVRYLNYFLIPDL